MAAKRRVLVADHDAPILRLVGDRLQANDDTVSTAANDQDALDEHAREHSDRGIVDMLLPVLDGVEMLKRVRDLAGWAT